MKRGFDIIDVLYGVLLLAFLIGVAWLKFHVWKIAHPQAPAWVFFAGG